MKHCIACAWGSALLIQNLHANPCAFQIKDIQSSNRQFTLVVSHDPRCSVRLSRDGDRLSLLPVIKQNTASKTDTKRRKTRGITKKDRHSGSKHLDKLIALAKSKIGSPYAYGKTGPDRFDCSGFVYYVFGQSGIAIPRTSRDQSTYRPKLTRDQLRRGDLLFFDTGNRGHVNHSGIYLGKGRFIHASSGKVYSVTISRLDRGFYQDKFRWGGRVEIP